MGLILSIETSTRSCSVALSLNGELVKSIEEVSEQYSHSEQLTVFIEELLLNENIKVIDLDAIAISSGPGSYTGLRIGTSTAKGLCYACGIPLIAIPTLDAMAEGMKNNYPDIQLCPMIDARRMEVYCAVYYSSLASSVEAKVINKDSFKKVLSQGSVLFFGDGANKCQNILSHPNAIFELGIYPSASDMIFLAENKYKNKEFEDLAYFEPFYLKPFQAGVNK
tara:strand:- start:1069 stop:1737 length:669 start_codon:yes stop_codon:yes gene_type:complete